MEEFRRTDTTKNGKAKHKNTINTYPPVSSVHLTWRASTKEGKDHAHLVFDPLFYPFGLVSNRDVQITVVFCVGSTSQFTPDFVAFQNGDRRGSVKHGLSSTRPTRQISPSIDSPGEDLLPVGVFRVRAGREAHFLVRARERNIKPRQEGVNVYESNQ